jgi:hypothetical protein
MEPLRIPKPPSFINLMDTIKKLISRKGFIKILDLNVKHMTRVTKMPINPTPIDEILVKFSIIY